MIEMIFIKIELEFSWVMTFPMRLREKGVLGINC